MQCSHKTTNLFIKFRIFPGTIWETHSTVITSVHIEKKKCYVGSNKVHMDMGKQNFIKLVKHRGIEEKKLKSNYKSQNIGYPNRNELATIFYFQNLSVHVFY